MRQPEPDGTSARRGLLKPRDRELIALVAMARYLSTAQLARLLWPGRDPSVARKRLYALAGLPFRERRPGAEPCRPVFNPPYLRRLRFRDSTGQQVDLWAVTLTGFALAVQQLGAERKLTREDVGPAFLEHSMTLTDLFVALAAPYVAAGGRAVELPFHWDPIDSKQLPWEEYDASAEKLRARRIVPDAVLEIPGSPRRYFVECEMGTHSIVAASDEKAGATLAKTERYDEFFSGGFYAQSFPDAWPADVLYLVRTDSRKASVNTALEKWARGRTGLAVRARAVTLADAEAELRPLLPAAAPAAPARRPPRALSITRGEAEAFKRFYQESLRRLSAAQKELNRPADSEYLALATRVRPVLARLCGTPRPLSQGGAA